MKTIAMKARLTLILAFPVIIPFILFACGVSSNDHAVSYPFYFTYPILAALFVLSFYFKVIRWIIQVWAILLSLIPIYTLVSYPEGVSAGLSTMVKFSLVPLYAALVAIVIIGLYLKREGRIKAAD